MDTSTSPRKPRAIVVGVDGSEQSIAALQMAASLVPFAGDAIRAVAAERSACPVLIAHGTLEMPEGESTAAQPVSASA